MIHYVRKRVLSNKDAGQADAVVSQSELHTPVLLLVVKNDHTSLLASIRHLETQTIDVLLNQRLLRWHYHPFSSMLL